MTHNYLEKFLSYLDSGTIVYLGTDNGPGWLCIETVLHLRNMKYMLEHFKDRYVVEVYLHNGTRGYAPGLAILIEGDEIGEF